MPIVWRYLLGQYLKVFLLCLISFIAILLTTRLDEIAHFATLGSEGLMILWFTLHQIPYLLPIAIPISSLISTIILLQRMSHTHEMTAFRACGLSLREVLTPILISGLFIAAVNFYIVSELATQSHLVTSLTKMELRSVNPLLLLHNKHLMRLKGAYSDTLGNSKIGEFAGDIIIAMPNKHNSSINLIVARNLQADPLNFHGKNLTLITPMNPLNTPKGDQLMVENMQSMHTAIKDFLWTLNNDPLRLGLFTARTLDFERRIKKPRAHDENEVTRKQLKRSINRGYAEIFHRLSISIAVFTFTLMGAAFGINIGRHGTNRGIVYVIGLASLYIVAFFSAKALENQMFTASLLYFIPHVIIITLSLYMLTRLSKGIESA